VFLNNAGISSGFPIEILFPHDKFLRRNILSRSSPESMSSTLGKKQNKNKQTNKNALSVILAKNTNSTFLHTIFADSNGVVFVKIL